MQADERVGSQLPRRSCLSVHAVRSIFQGKRSRALAAAAGSRLSEMLLSGDGLMPKATGFSILRCTECGNDFPFDWRPIHSLEDAGLCRRCSTEKLMCPDPSEVEKGFWGPEPPEGIPWRNGNGARPLQGCITSSDLEAGMADKVGGKVLAENMRKVRAYVATLPVSDDVAEALVFVGGVLAGKVLGAAEVLECVADNRVMPEEPC